MSGEICTVPWCENAHHRKGLCASCYKAMSSLRRLHGEDRARELMLLEPPSDDEDVSLVDDSAVDDDVVIDLSGDGVVSTASVTRDEAIQLARDAMDRAEAARVPEASNIDDDAAAIIGYLIDRWHATGSRALLVELQVALNELL